MLSSVNLFLAKGNNEGTYELCASGTVVIQGVVKQEKCAHDVWFICPLSASSNEERNAISASDITCSYVAKARGYYLWITSRAEVVL